MLCACAVLCLLVQLSSWLRCNASPLQGVFLTTVSFAEEGMNFSPDRNAVLDVVNNNSIEGSITLTQAAPRLLFMRGFSHFFEGKPSGLNPVSIIK